MVKNELEKAGDKRVIDVLKKHCRSRNHALALANQAFPSMWGVASHEAELFLLEQLQNGPKRLSTLIERGRPLGLTYRTLRRAAIKLELTSKTKGWGKNRVARWSLHR